MSDPRHYYDVLELPVFAPPEAVKGAYRKLARLHHPDLNQQNRTASEERLKQINEAYEVLKDAQRRALYDEHLRQKLSPTPPPSVKPPSPSSSAIANAATKTSQSPVGGIPPKPVAPKASSATTPTKVSLKANEGKHPFRWLFEPWKVSVEERSAPTPSKPSPRPAPSPVPKASTPGQTLETSLLLTVHEAQSGCVKSIPLTIKTGCAECAATGRANGQICSACTGDRLITQHRSVEVKIPAGVKAGAKIRVSGEGAASPDATGPAGDLVLTIQLPTTPQLQIRGLNAYLDWRISLPLAVLGGQIPIPTVHGSLTVTIPAGSQPDQILRLKEQGVHQGAMKGDQFVTLQVPMPTTLSPKQRKLYEQLLRLETD